MNSISFPVTAGIKFISIMLTDGSQTWFQLKFKSRQSKSLVLEVRQWRLGRQVLPGRRQGASRTLVICAMIWFLATQLCLVHENSLSWILMFMFQHIFYTSIKFSLKIVYRLHIVLQQYCNVSPYPKALYYLGPVSSFQYHSCYHWSKSQSKQAIINTHNASCSFSWSPDFISHCLNLPPHFI